MAKTLKVVLAVTLLWLTYFQAKSQDETGLEKSVYGIQLEWIGVNVFGEYRLGNELSLRGEIGLRGGYVGGTGIKNNWEFTPVVAIMPRWYFDLDKRISRGKKTIHNSASFVDFRIEYVSGGDLDGVDGLFIRETFRFGPSIGIRRHIGKSVSYELSLGIFFSDDLSSSFNSGIDTEILPGVRVGYTF